MTIHTMMESYSAKTCRKDSEIHGNGSPMSMQPSPLLIFIDTIFS